MKEKKKMRLRKKNGCVYEKKDAFKKKKWMRL